MRHIITPVSDLISLTRKGVGLAAQPGFRGFLSNQPFTLINLSFHYCARLYDRRKRGVHDYEISVKAVVFDKINL